MSNAPEYSFLHLVIQDQYNFGKITHFSAISHSSIHSSIGFLEKALFEYSNTPVH